MVEPRWLEKNLVLTVHKMQISRFGGLDEIRDIGLLESALAKPKHYYTFNGSESQVLPKLASKYLANIIQNHPFVDGNKRTGLISMHLFLHLNGFEWRVSEEMQYIKVMLLASGKISENEFMNWVLETL